MGSGSRGINGQGVSLMAASLPSKPLLLLATAPMALSYCRLHIAGIAALFWCSPSFTIHVGGLNKQWRKLCMNQTLSMACDGAFSLCTDVRLFPFHATSTGLPELDRGTWKDIISGSASSNQNMSSSIVERPRERTAGILLSEPHFIAVGHHYPHGMHMLKAETPTLWLTCSIWYAHALAWRWPGRSFVQI